MTLRQRFLGVLALAGLAAILIGLPALLIAIGANSLPQGLPTWDQARATLLSPDDGTLVLTVLQGLGWVVWAALSAPILVAAFAQVRGRPAPSLPGLNLPQSTIRGVVATALALFIAVPGLTATSTADAAPATGTTHPTTTATVQLEPVTSLPQSQTPEVNADRPAPQDEAPLSTVDYTVKPGDTLWSIAQQHLGQGDRYPAIVELNPGALTYGPDWIDPGTTLRLPADTPSVQQTRVDERVVVEEGDTLSALADEYLDDASQWLKIYRASQDIEQPDGRRLRDPDLIYPGWHLDIPDDASDHAAETATPEQAEPPTDSDVVPKPVAEPGPVVSLKAGDTAGPRADAGADIAIQPGPTKEAASDPPAAQEQRESSTSAITGVNDTSEDPHWMLAGLVGSGALLGGGLFLALGNRRRAQFRHRRPSRTIATPEPGLAPVEQTVNTSGATAAPTLQTVDEVLRRLGAQCRVSGLAVPVLAAAQLTEHGLTLHLSNASDLGAPWTGSVDQLHWHLPAGTPQGQVGPTEPDQPAPYPLLVSIGAGDDGDLWLLNVEDLQVSITGPTEYTHDFTRYLAAEIAVNPWSSRVRLDLFGVAEEVTPMNSTRVRIGSREAVSDVVADTVSVLDRLDEDMDVPTARVGHVGDETWPARMILATAEASNSDQMRQVTQLLSDHSGRTGVSVVICGDNAPEHAVELVLTPAGRLLMPESGLDLVAVGLTADEALGCAALLTQGEQLEDTAMPVPAAQTGDEGWRAWSDQAGALRTEHTTPRDSPHDTSTADQTHTLLEDPDEEYLASAATTTEDLDALSPRVSEHVKQQIVDADPGLDDDLAAWWDPNSALPRLTLLGPVSARTRGKPLVDRKPYFTEMLAYLALRPNGATAEETADAFNITTNKCRDYMGRCREWLGTNPRTGQPHLPHAAKAPAARARGGNIYQVLDVLVDADIFRRLRTRAEAQGGPEGIEDLRQALKLVQGPPFAQLRRGGWAWLSSGDRVDQHMVCAIVDVAHIVTTHELGNNNPARARAAAEVASLAAPHEEIPALDLAAVASAERHHQEAIRLLQTQVCDRTDDTDAMPGDLPKRTQQVIDQHKWLDREKAG